MTSRPDPDISDAAVMLSLLTREQLLALLVNRPPDNQTILAAMTISQVLEGIAFIRGEDVAAQYRAALDYNDLDAASTMTAH